jgi:hypothetical protein
MGQETHCAYNQTKGYFLGLDVAATDSSLGSLDERALMLAPKSGGGLWMVPFRGISATGVRTPLDLVYLNESCSVLDIVESFPTARVSPSTPQAASVLALPIQTIFNSHTQAGDQVLVCTAEELEWHLSRFASINSFARAVKRPASFNEEPFFREDMRQMEERFEPQPVLQQRAEAQRFDLERAQEQASESLILNPFAKGFKRPSRSWLQRLLEPEPVDPRAPREMVPTLSAFFWTGGQPVPHPIRDISATGLYVVTKERWYLGTMIRMTLTLTGLGEKTPGKSISVHAKAVRYGEDGVGLQFMLAGPKDKSRERDSMIQWLDKMEMERFLQQVLNR